MTTTQTVHTAGQWKVTHNTEDDSTWIDSSDPLNFNSIAQVYRLEPGYEANARLIAAAPELLAALKAASQALTLLDPLGKHHDALAIDEALNHAEGRP